MSAVLVLQWCIGFGKKATVLLMHNLIFRWFRVVLCRCFRGSRMWCFTLCYTRVWRRSACVGWLWLWSMVSLLLCRRHRSLCRVLVCHVSAIAFPKSLLAISCLFVCCFWNPHALLLIENLFCCCLPFYLFPLRALSGRGCCARSGRGKSGERYMNSR